MGCPLGHLGKSLKKYTQSFRSSNVDPRRPLHALKVYSLDGRGRKRALAADCFECEEGGRGLLVDLISQTKSLILTTACEFDVATETSHNFVGFSGRTEYRQFQQIDTPPGKAVLGRIAPCGFVRPLDQSNPVSREVLLSVSAARKAGEAESF